MVDIGVNFELNFSAVTSAFVCLFHGATVLPIRNTLIHRDQRPIAMLDGFAGHIHLCLRREDEAIA